MTDIYCILDTIKPLPPLPNVPQKTYVNPLIYVDVVDAVQEFTNEIDPALLTLENLIGAGINLLFYFCFSSGTNTNMPNCVIIPKLLLVRDIRVEQRSGRSMCCRSISDFVNLKSLQVVLFLCLYASYEEENVTI